MRNLVIWTLSFVLGFEPALMAQGNARQNADIKAFIEMSGLNKRPVTFRELYSKFSPYLPQAQKDELKHFIQTYGDQQIPKIDVSKIKVSGSPDEVYKLQMVSNGQAGTLEIFNDSKQFARVNGQALTAEDMKSTAAVMTKMGMPADVAASEFKRPARPHGVLLSREEIAKLKKEDQIKYFKNFREMLASVEAVQNVQMKLKAARLDLDSNSKFEIVARWLRGEEAFAVAVDDTCVAAGYATTQVVREKSGKTAGRWTCGSDGSGGIPAEFATRTDGSPCPAREFACNKIVYGPKGGMNCVPAGKDTTQLCNKMAEGNDIPDVASENQDAKKAFEDLKQAAESELQKALDVCKAYPKSEGRKRSKNPTQGLIDDQAQTCDQLRIRETTIKGWDCKNEKSDFKTKYPKICEERQKQEKEEGGSRPTETTDGANGNEGRPKLPPDGESAGGADASKNKGSEVPSCDALPPQYSLSSRCDGGRDSRPSDNSITCRDSSGKILTYREIYECICKEGDREVPATERNKCSKGGGSSSSEGAGGKTKSWFSRNAKWLIPLGAGLLGLFIFHWLAKKQVQQSFQYLEPKPPAQPPLAPPVVSPPAPVPRATQ